MLQRVSHIRQRVLTKPFSQAVLTFIYNILAPRNSPDAKPYVRPFALQFRKFIDTAKMKGLGHADIHAPGMAAAQIAFRCHTLHAIELNAAEGTGHNTQAAAKTSAFVNHHGMGPCIAAEGSGWTDLHAHGDFTLPARDRKNTSQIHIHVDEYVGCITLVGFRLMKKTDPLAAQACNAPVDFNKNNVHDVSCES
jgi:hypothetical protein